MILSVLKTLRRRGLWQSKSIPAHRPGCFPKIPYIGGLPAGMLAGGLLFPAGGGLLLPEGGGVFVPDGGALLPEARLLELPGEVLLGGVPLLPLCSSRWRIRSFCRSTIASNFFF